MGNPYAKQWASNIGKNVASAVKKVANVPLVDVSVRKQTNDEVQTKRQSRDANPVKVSDYWLGPKLSVTRDKSPNIPKGLNCRDSGSVNRGTPPGTGGGGGGRTTTTAVTSTPPAWSGNEPDCPIKSQESIDNFTTNPPKPKHPGVKIKSPPKNTDKPSKPKPPKTETPKSETPSSGGSGGSGKKYNPKGLPKWSEEGLWGQYR